MSDANAGMNEIDEKAQPFGILAALPEEIEGLIALMLPPVGFPEVVTQRWGQRDFHLGILHGRTCVVALSRVGKVAAAATAAALIHRFNVSGILFVGVAGGVAENVRVGDIVIGEDLIQHDMDASPLFPKFEIPLLKRAVFKAQPLMSDTLTHAAQRFATALPEADHALHRTITVHRGMIASGDQFVSDPRALAALRSAIPELLAVDMESAAVAQVCHEHDVPFAVVRSISDGADDEAALSFARFLKEVAGRYALGILLGFLSDLPASA